MTPDRIPMTPVPGEEMATAADVRGVGPEPEPEAPTSSPAPGHPTIDAAAAAEEQVRALERRLDEERARLGRKAEDWERACKAALKEKELAAALAGRSLVRGAASQLIALWRDELEVVDEAGRLRVRSRDGRAVEEAVSSWLASPDYAHFSRPTSRGGPAPGDPRSAATAPPAPAPRTLGEAVLLRWREAAQAARQDPAAPIGLGRRRG